MDDISNHNKIQLYVEYVLSIGMNHELFVPRGYVGVFINKDVVYSLLDDNEAKKQELSLQPYTFSLQYQVKQHKKMH